MTLRDTIINAVAGTIVLAAGGTIIGLRVHDATQDEQIVQLQHLDENVTQLSADLQRVDAKLEHLNGQLEGEQRVPRN